MTNLFIFLDILSAIIIFLLGYYVLLKDSRRMVNRIFFLFTLVLTLIAISSAGLRILGFQPGISPEEQLRIVSGKIQLFNFLNNLGWIGIAFIASIFLHLTSLITKEKKLLEKKFLFIIYFLSFFFLILAWFCEGAFGCEKIQSYFYILFTIYFSLVNIFSLFLLIRKYIRIKSFQEKIKIFYFILGFLIPFFGSLSLDVLAPLIKYGEFTGVSYSLYFVTVGYVFIGIGILRYGLFIDYREVLEISFKRLIELFIVTDENGFILSTNEMTLSKLGYTEDEFSQKKIEEILKGGRERWKEIERKLEKTKTLLEEKTSFFTKKGEEIPFLLSLYQAKGRIIFVGRDIKEVLEYQKKLEQEIKKKTEELEEAKSVLEIKVTARTRELSELTRSLEEQVKERTKELRERVEELEKFQKVAVARELKMIELKEEIRKLKKELEKYKK